MIVTYLNFATSTEGVPQSIQFYLPTLTYPPTSLPPPTPTKPCHLLYTCTKSLFFQVAQQLARQLSMQSSAPLINCATRSIRRLGFGIGLWLYSKSLYFSFCFFTCKFHIHSDGLHSSLSSDLRHYTIFTFEKEGCRLKQRWSMHVCEDGSWSWVRSEKRRISSNSLTHLFVCFFLVFSRNTLLSIFFQG